jgi:hypothetical protein
MPLITDARALATIRIEWSAVVKVREHMRKLMTGPVGSIADGALHSVVYNLPLLLAFNVLEKVLRALKRQRQIPGSSEQLGDLLDMFQGDPSWLEWSVLRDGERRQHAIVASGELFSGVECLTDIQAVEEQLGAWEILESGRG